MKNFTLFTIFIFLALTAKTFAFTCLNNVKINKDLNNLNLNEFENREFIPGVNIVEVPFEFFCKNTKAKNTKLQLFFIKEKLKRIIFEYQGSLDRPIFNIAQNFYKAGFKKNQNIIDMREIEQYLIKEKNIIYVYQNIKGEGENFKQINELFDIIDKSYEELMLEFSLSEELKKQ